jgi:hypothetical protein
MGWAMFHVVSAEGGSQKDVNGYFLTDFNAAQLTVGDCSPSPCDGTPGILGSYALKLIE